MFPFFKDLLPSLAATVSTKFASFFLDLFPFIPKFSLPIKICFQTSGIPARIEQIWCHLEWENLFGSYTFLSDFRLICFLWEVGGSREVYLGDDRDKASAKQHFSSEDQGFYGIGKQDRSPSKFDAENGHFWAS